MLRISYRTSTTFEIGLTNMYTTSMGFFAIKIYLAKLLQSLNKLCGSQSGFVEPLQAFNWCCNGQNVLAEHLHPPQAFNRLQGIVKTCITICYRRSTGFAAVKSRLLKLHSSSVGNMVAKAALLSLYILSTESVTCPWRMVLQHRSCSSENRHDNPVQPFSYLCGSKRWPEEHLQAFN